MRPPQFSEGELRPRLDCVVECQNFYAVETLLAEVDMARTKDPFLPSLARLSSDLQEVRDHVVLNLSRAMIDYIALICFGEARHAKEFSKARWRQFEDFHIGSSSCRTDAISYAKSFSPESILTVCEELFGYDWNPHYGGAAWRNIASTGLKFLRGEWNAMTFLDVAWHLRHTSSLAFDKEVIFSMEISMWRMIDFLDARHNCRFGPAWGVLFLTQTVRSLLERYFYLVVARRRGCKYGTYQEYASSFVEKAEEHIPGSFSMISDGDSYEPLQWLGTAEILPITMDGDLSRFEDEEEEDMECEEEEIMVIDEDEDECPAVRKEISNESWTSYKLPLRLLPKGSRRGEG